jgi:serine/threonine protein kinase
MRGAYKKGKPCWILSGDSEAKEYVEMTAIIEASPGSILPVRISDPSSLKNEVLISQYLGKNCPYIAISEMGPVHVKKSAPHIQQVCIYQPKAMIDMSNFIGIFQNLLNETQKNTVIMHMLLALEHMHNNGYIHQDISLENFLYFKTDDGLIIKVNDFGATVHHTDDSNPVSSRPFPSPEMIYYYSKQEQRFKYYHDLYYKNRDSYAKCCSTQVSDWGDESAYNRPHTANDVWALGLNLYCLLNNHDPKTKPLTNIDVAFIESNPLLKGMLTIKRNERFTMQQAVACHQQMTQKLSDDLSAGLTKLTI